MTVMPWRAKRDIRDAELTRVAFRESVGAEAEDERAQEIAHLTSVQWKGRTLYTLHCLQCDSDRNVTGGVLWALVDLKHYRCAWCLVRG